MFIRKVIHSVAVGFWTIKIISWYQVQKIINKVAGLLIIFKYSCEKLNHNKKRLVKTYGLYNETEIGSVPNAITVFTTVMHVYVPT